MTEVAARGPGLINDTTHVATLCNVIILSPGGERGLGIKQGRLLTGFQELPGHERNGIECLSFDTCISFAKLCCMY